MENNTDMERIPLARPDISDREIEYVLDCLKTNALSQGGYNKKFEEAFALRAGAAHATLCSNGTAALWLALKACGIGPGDEVIVPAFTFSATAASVVAVGATVVFADVREHDTNIDPASVEHCITPRTKAIITVDLYGFPADHTELRKIADAHDLYLIEDAAEAIGASANGKQSGTFGDIGCFSMYANKIITSGEGGVCITDDRELLEKMILYKNHGTPRGKAYWVEVPGFNLRMTNMQAALAFAQLERMDDFLNARYTVFDQYQSLLEGAKSIRLLPYSKERTYGPWMYTVRVPSDKRDFLLQELEKRGIESRPGFHALHLTPAFAFYAQGKKFPIAEMLSSEIVNLPTYVGLTKAQIERVVHELKDTLAV